MNEVEPLKLLGQLAERLAPRDVIGMGLLLLRHTERFGRVPRGTAAWCSRGEHIAIRSELRRQGNWPGFWPSCIIFVEQPNERYLIHELAHLLPAKLPTPDIDREPTTVEVAEQNAELAAWADGTDDRKPWDGHGLDFIRSCIHLHHRSWQLGVEVGVCDIDCAGERYALSPAYRYMHALDDEPTRMADASFAEIHSTPMPEEFEQLFQSDVEKYYQKHREELWIANN